MSISCKPLTNFYAEKLDRFFGIKNCLYEYNPGNYIMPPQFVNIAQQILDFPVKKDDVWMISYPRTGSTWCQEMVWLIGNDLNFDAANKTIQLLRAPVLEMSSILIKDEYKEFMTNYGNSVDFVRNCSSPRFIKSHLPLEVLPVEVNKVKPKIIYIARNPKDVCVSYYYHCQEIHNLQCTFEEFADLFLKGKVPVGSIWSHYFSYWGKRNEGNVLFLKYEDMKRDLKAVIRRTAQFLQKILSEEQVDDLYAYLDFNSMKNNRSVNFEPILRNAVNEECIKGSPANFIRKGLVGDWKNCMTRELSKQFDEWIEENTEGNELHF